MNMDLKQIGQFIQSCRKDLKMTQAELSERLSTSPQAVSNWERCESLPDISLLPDLACILRYSVDAILLEPLAVEDIVDTLRLLRYEKPSVPSIELVNF